MKRLLALLALAAAALAGGCSAGASALPLTDSPPPTPSSSSVFVGHGKAFRFVDGSWKAAPGYDYDYLVLERRYPGRWEAVKEIHRRSPEYDGRAGPRDQTLSFTVRTSPAADGGEDLAVESTLGRGTGHVGPGGAGVVLEMASARTGWFIPYDTIRIRQERPPGEGRIRETVELLSKKKGSERPFMKIEEEGLLYLPVKR